MYRNHGRFVNVRGLLKAPRETIDGWLAEAPEFAAPPRPAATLPTLGDLDFGKGSGVPDRV
jgi:hypothetical protein